MRFLCSLENLENIRLTQQRLMVISNDLKAHFTLLDKTVQKLFWFQKEKALGEEKNIKLIVFVFVFFFLFNFVHFT